ncbi:MAG: carboxypeptidase-like regulatory domain-containing protein [Geminicoccales bacterium]
MFDSFTKQIRCRRSNFVKPGYFRSLCKMTFICTMISTCAFAESDIQLNEPVASDTDDNMHDSAINEGVVGTVQNDSGEPIPNVLVQAFPLDPDSGPVPEIAILTDADGRYAWPLPPGRYRFSIVSETEMTETKDDVLVETGKRVELNFVIH